MSRQHVRVFRKSRGPEAAAASDASVASLGRCVPPASGCPLSLQPSTNLALVCRFLSSRDLLSAYKMSHALSAAAASPLTFQHESEWRIDHADKGVETIGPAAVCTGEARLSAALQSRLFRAFRILKIRADKQEEIAVMLQMLQLPTAPVLHVLQIEWTSRLSACLFGFSSSLSFPFVKVLSLQAVDSISYPTAMRRFPFPRLQVLEIAQTQFPLELLQAWLPVLPQSSLRQIVIRPPRPRCAVVESWPRGILCMLSGIDAALPDLTEIHWLQRLDPRVFVDEIRQWQTDHANALPQLRKIRFVHCLAFDGFTDFDAHVLRVFPAVEELQLSFRLHIPLDGFFRDSFISQQLELTGLSQLRRLTLQHTSDDGRSLMTPLTGFHRVFESMPLLEELDLGTLSAPLSAFASVPRLRTLSMRFLVSVHDNDRMNLCFPSLTALRMTSDPASRVFYSAVRQMPKLQTVQIRNLTPRPKDEFVRDGLAAYDALELESAKMESEALMTTGWGHAFGSSATAVAASAFASASAPLFVEWQPSGVTSFGHSFSLSSGGIFSAGKATNSSKSKGDKHATDAAATIHTQALPLAAPFTFGPPPSHVAPLPVCPAFDVSSLSSALTAPSFPSVAAPAPLSPAPLAVAEPNAAAAAFVSSALVFAPPPSIAASVSASAAAAVAAESSASPTAVSSSPDTAQL